MKLDGEIGEIHLIEELVELGRERFTGAIRFENDGVIKIIYFKRGDVLQASTNDRADAIDEILLRANKVSREHVKQALAKRKELETLGDALLRLGFITRKELTWARRVQVVGVIRSIAAWSAGSFTVVADYLPKRDEGTLFPLPQIVTELIVTDDDRAKFDAALDGGNAVLSKAADFDDRFRRLGLNEEATAIAALIDGVNSASQIAILSGSDPFNVYKLLHALHLLGLLTSEPTPQTPPLPIPHRDAEITPPTRPRKGNVWSRLGRLLTGPTPAELRMFAERQFERFRELKSGIHVRQTMALGPAGVSEDAVAQVLEWLDSASGLPVLIQGDAGMGKSALLYELARRLTARDDVIPVFLPWHREFRGSTLVEMVQQQFVAFGLKAADSGVQALIDHGELVLLVDDVDDPRALADVARGGKLVMTTRIQASPSGWSEYGTLLPFDRSQIQQYLHLRLRDEPRSFVDRWDWEGWMELASIPLYLSVLTEVYLRSDGERSAIEALSITIAHVTERLAGSTYDSYPQHLALFAIADRRWQKQAPIPLSEIVGAVKAAMSLNTLTDPAEATDLLISTFLRPAARDSYQFIHPALEEWFLAWGARYAIGGEADPPGWDTRPITPGTIAFFCVLADERAADWALRVIDREDPASALHANAMAVLHAMGRRPVITPAAISVAIDEGARARADEEEQQGRELLIGHAYEDATAHLRAAAAADPERAERIETEFGFLFRLGTRDDAAAGLRWCTDFWKYLARDGAPLTIAQPAAEAAAAPAVEVKQVVAPRAARKARAVAPGEAGEELETAALRLFSEFFALAESEEGVRIQLTKLRKQRRGSQFGYDLAFEATVAGRENVRCHVECKNYSSSISLKDVADKLLQQKTHGVKIDHWILISPHTDPAQDLHHLLEHDDTRRDFPFDIHVWSPETKVMEFFGLEPEIYDRFYPEHQEDTHPRDWSAEKRHSVVEFFRDILRPVLRLPDGWRDYTRDERHICFSETERSDFETAFPDAVALGVKDRQGGELPGTAIDRLCAWLAEPSPRIAFVLGEFGDGKSFLTYSLSRKLLESFRDAPETGIVPLRLPLRQFTTTRTVRDFLEARLEQFGAGTASWARIKAGHKTLVILDGFDEMSKQLDPETVTNNIRALLDCCAAPEFDSSKILITSRTHFFETGDAYRLLGRLGKPLFLQLARIPRGQVLGHLQESVKGTREQDLLRRLSRMHDPIGLATKPLFLRMLRETLQELPVDLDEVTVYERYAVKSLERKIDLLDDPDLRSVPGETVSRLMDVLGLVAAELQAASEAYVSLRKLGQEGTPFAELLWRITGDKRLDADADAEARLGSRSLLSKVQAFGGEGEWRVDFCHRSMREYFVARQFVEMLGRSADEAASFLSRVPVNHEVLYFSACLLRRAPSENVERLHTLISRSRAGGDEHYLGGKALTMLLHVSSSLPRSLDYTGRNFDLADLEDGDLSALDFSGSTFRSANFANVNLEDADLSRCDLTGVRLHETTSVLAVCAPNADRVLASYEDGTIWEWDLSAGGKPSSRVVFSQNGLCVSRLGLTRSGMPWAIAGREALLFEASTAEWTCLAKLPLKQACDDFVVREGTLAILLTDIHARCVLVGLEGPASAVEIPSSDCSAFTAVSRGLLCFRQSESVVRLRGMQDGRQIDVQVPLESVTALDAVLLPTGEIDVVAGEAEGRLRVFRVTRDGAATEIFCETVHAGAVQSVAFADPQTLVSGGRDRKIAVTSTRGAIGRTMQLIVRCKGLKTDGLEPKAQRDRLEELKSRVAAPMVV